MGWSGGRCGFTSPRTRGKVNRARRFNSKPRFQAHGRGLSCGVFDVRTMSGNLAAEIAVGLAYACFRDATKTPVNTIAKPMTWNNCGRSPRNSRAITDPNNGTR
jgi:hypothetical protein